MRASGGLTSPMRSLPVTVYAPAAAQGGGAWLLVQVGEQPQHGCAAWSTQAHFTINYASVCAKNHKYTGMVLLVLVVMSE